MRGKNILIMLLGISIVLFFMKTGSGEITPQIRFIYGIWGDKPGEFGIDASAPHPWNDWPNDFFVDGENLIYILDNVNKRVQVFDDEGKFVRIDEEMYKRAREKGRTREHIFSDGKKEEVATGLLLKEKNEVFSREAQYMLDERKHVQNGETVFSVIITLPSSEKTGISFIRNFTSAISVGPIGEDKTNNFYFSIFEHMIDGEIQARDMRYVKVSPRGEILGEIIIYIPQVKYYYTSPRVRLSPSGDIYLMSCDEKGFWIDRYPTELFDKPEGRDFTYLYREPSMAN